MKRGVKMENEEGDRLAFTIRTLFMPDNYQQPIAMI